MPTLQNKIIIITGSTRGFGYAIAQACLAAGAVVVITGRSQEAIDRAISGLQEPARCAPGSARWRTWYDEPGESSIRRSATCWRRCGSRAMIAVQPAGQV